MITTLQKNQVFVFGSNLAGFHGAGAARQAFEEFDAELGIGEGLVGNTYALPTLDRALQKRTDEDLTRSIQTFFAAALRNPDKQFLLTKVGCGIAGYDEHYIRAKFKDAPANVILPEDWR